jgi:outer membrane protein assembly factor BamE (lipoprotein component of BamABCDE complex)
MTRSAEPEDKRALPARRTLALCLVGLGLATALPGCDATRIDRHGHVFTDVDLQQIQNGMSKDQVRLALGTPDTTGTVGGDVFYYISSTQRTRPMGKPQVVDRKVLAVYFDRQDSVRQVANYGLKDGIVFDFIKGETPTSGKQLSAVEQLLGNIANRRELIKNESEQIPGAPR